ncbi:MAG: AAA family ATPase [Halobacteriaceae archaeon]
MTGSRVLAVASGKGGVGKTTTAVALGACAAAAGRSAVVVDADLGMGNLGTMVGLTDATPTVHDVLAGSADVDDAIHEAPGDFDVVPGSANLEQYAEADPAGLRDVVEDLRARYDLVVLDSGAGLSHDTVLPLGLADEVVLVTTAADIAVANTATTREVANRLGADVRGVLVTSATGDVDTVRERIDAPILGTVPRDEAIESAADAGVPVTVHAPESPAARAYAEFVASVLEVPVTSMDLPDATTAETTGETPAETPAPDIPDAEGATLTDEDEAESEPEQSRSLINRLSGGLIGGNDNN